MATDPADEREAVEPAESAMEAALRPIAAAIVSTEGWSNAAAVERATERLAHIGMLFATEEGVSAYESKYPPASAELRHAAMSGIGCLDDDSDEVASDIRDKMEKLMAAAVRAIRWRRPYSPS